MHSNEELFRIGALYALHGQGLLEVMDGLKETNIYKGKTKQLINQLTKELEKDRNISFIFDEGQGEVTKLSQKSR